MAAAHPIITGLALYLSLSLLSLHFFLNAVAKE